MSARLVESWEFKVESEERKAFEESMFAAIALSARLLKSTSFPSSILKMLVVLSKVKFWSSEPEEEIKLLKVCDESAKLDLIAVAVSLRALSCWLLAVCSSVLNCEVESASKALVLFVESVRLVES